LLIAGRRRPTATQRRITAGQRDVIAGQRDLVAEQRDVIAGRCGWARPIPFSRFRAPRRSAAAFLRADV
jgi:hypothetical protein